MNYHLLPSPQT